MTVAVQTSVEILRFKSESQRAGLFFSAFLRDAAAAGVETTVSRDTYRGGADWLLVWGPGAADRFEPMARQVAGGGHCAALDLAYWSRDTKVRVSIDAAHPQAWVMRHDWPRARFESDKVPIAERWDPKGPVIVAGIGRKARAQYEPDTVLAWERSMIEACRARWPKRCISYRRKQLDAPIPQGVNLMGAGPIDQALNGASLVITWHSNVAVDAIRMGIPVVCRDGAAAAVCPSTLTDEPTPLATDLRNRFLGNLAWFQWGSTQSESTKFWSFLREVIA